MALSWVLRAPGPPGPASAVPTSMWNFYQVAFIKIHPSWAGSDVTHRKACSLLHRPNVWVSQVKRKTGAVFKWGPGDVGGQQNCVWTACQTAGVSRPFVLVVEGLPGTREGRPQSPPKEKWSP